MNNSSLPPFIMVDNHADWNQCVQDLKRFSRLAIDLESNSMYVYKEEICLIQISTVERDYIIDPQSDIDFYQFGELLADASIEKIFHAAEYDLMLIKRQHGWHCQNLFDTMWAARILGYNRIGLANMLKDLFDIGLDKRFQRANWGERPLSPEQLQYAQRDTHYLFRLRDQLASQLREKGHWDEAQETFARQCDVKPSDQTFDPDRFWSIAGVQKLKPQHRAIAKALYIFRHEQAQMRNFPLFKIMSNDTLLRLAAIAPRNLAELRGIKNVSRKMVQYRGKQILRVINDARDAPIPKRPRRDRRPPVEVLDRYQALQSWRKARGIERGVESDVIMSREALWKIAENNPQTATEFNKLQEFIGPWRSNRYRDDLLQLLQSIHESSDLEA